MDDGHNTLAQSYAQISKCLQRIRDTRDYQSKSKPVEDHCLEKVEAILRSHDEKEKLAQLILLKQLVCREYPFDPSLLSPLLAHITEAENIYASEHGVSAPPPSPQFESFR